MLKKALGKRDELREEEANHRVELVRLNKAEEKDKQLSKLQRKRIKVMRKMFNDRKQEDHKVKKPSRNIIND